MWPSTLWEDVLSAGKNSKLGKTIKATVEAKSKKGPSSESKLKYFLLQQAKYMLEDVVFVFIPGSSGPCETKVPDFFLVEKGHKDCSTTETIGAFFIPNLLQR